MKESALRAGCTYDAFLFDMDGTLLDSTAVVERVWGRWCARNGFDPALFIRTIHGVRAIDVITPLALPGVDPRREAIVIQDEELIDVEGIRPVPGAIEFLRALPRDRWAIVTSAPTELARKRMAAAGIPFPDVMISGEDVANGKPNPACYLLGAKRLGFAPAKCLAFEDATAGILAAEGAGSDVTVITATHHTKMVTSYMSVSDYHALRAFTLLTGQLKF
ncbi:HAD family hydrolase [Shinella sp.]|uniref:HAD family hydrolase n=1 Tax=Shinella sp. TaxID=1870904 RepID=UPI0029A17C3D|nr:HAD family hydrolase [Shinella sp.]MDX3978582.1 HAD family hydrolase [Shinella sp.]